MPRISRARPLDGAPPDSRAGQLAPPAKLARVAPAESFDVAPGEGPSVEDPTRGRITFKATGDATGGALTVIEATAAPGEGPPLHVHRGRDETIYVLNGRYVRHGIPARRRAARARRERQRNDVCSSVFDG